MRVNRDGEIVEEEIWDLTEEDQAMLALEQCEAGNRIPMKKTAGKWVQCGDLPGIEDGYQIVSIDYLCGEES
jgi:hypothetical protein